MLLRGLWNLLRVMAGKVVSTCRVTVLFLRAKYFENVNDGKRITVIVKCLAVGATQQLKTCDQIADKMVCGLVCSCVPSRVPVQSLYQRVHKSCPILDLP